MEESLDELTALLEREAELHEQLLILLNEEGESYGKASGAELLQLQSAKSQVVRRIEQLEQERITLVQGLARHWDLPAPELRLRQIAERCGGAHGQALSDCHYRLTSLLEQIRQSAERNGRLSESRLKSVNAAIRFMSEAQGLQQTYSEAGKLQSGKSKFSRSSV